MMFFSEHGTIVDNIVYSLDAAGHKSDMPKAKAAKFEANCLKMSADNKQVGEEGCFCDKSLGKVALEVSWLQVSTNGHVRTESVHSRFKGS